MSRLNELKQIARLEAMQTPFDKINDKKIMTVYEIIEMKIPQKNRLTTKTYYHKLREIEYVYQGTFSEIELYRDTLREYQAISPFQIYVKMENSKDNEDLLVKYYNEQSEKYFKLACRTGQFQRFKMKLGAIKDSIKNVSDLQLLHDTEFILKI